MCRRTTCKRCQRPSWAGCGAHVEQVLGDVPKAQRCQCDSSPKKSASSATDAEPKPNWLFRLLNR